MLWWESDVGVRRSDDLAVPADFWNFMLLCFHVLNWKRRLYNQPFNFTEKEKHQKWKQTKCDVHGVVIKRRATGLSFIVTSMLPVFPGCQVSLIFILLQNDHKMSCPVIISKVEVIKTWIENRITARLVQRPFYAIPLKILFHLSTTCLL